MPVTVEFRPTASPGTGNYAIVEKATRRIVGRSRTRKKAQSSARIRNAAYHRKQARKRSR